MKKLQVSRIIQALIFVLLAAASGVFNSKLDTLQFLLESDRMTVPEVDATVLVSDLKTVRILGIIFWGIAMGLYISYTHSLKRAKENS